MAKIYTKTGDGGTTGLLAPRRVSKDHPRIEAYGTVDELNAVLGVARSQLQAGSDADAILSLVQGVLFEVGSALADPDPDGPFFGAVDASRVEELERTIDRLEADLPPLTQFVLPGGTPASAQVHLARTVCRRAERAVIHLKS